MQQLNSRLPTSLSPLPENRVSVDLPLPESPARAHQFVEHLCNGLVMRAAEPEWGADRLQVVLSSGDMRIRVHMEWLCDAIWIEWAERPPVDTVLCDWIRERWYSLQS